MRIHGSKPVQIWPRSADGARQGTGWATRIYGCGKHVVPDGTFVRVAVGGGFPADRPDEVRFLAPGEMFEVLDAGAPDRYAVTEVPDGTPAYADDAALCAAIGVPRP